MFVNENVKKVSNFLRCRCGRENEPDGRSYGEDREGGEGREAKDTNCGNFTSYSSHVV